MTGSYCLSLNSIISLGGSVNSMTEPLLLDIIPVRLKRNRFFDMEAYMISPLLSKTIDVIVELFLSVGDEQTLTDADWMDVGMAVDQVTVDLSLEANARLVHDLFFLEHGEVLIERPELGNFGGDVYPYLEQILRPVLVALARRHPDVINTEERRQQMIAHFSPFGIVEGSISAQVKPEVTPSEIAEGLREVLTGEECDKIQRMDREMAIYQAMMSLSDAGISPQQFLKDRGWWKEEDLGN